MQKLLVVGDGTRLFQDLSDVVKARRLPWDLGIATTAEGARQALVEQAFDAVLCEGTVCGIKAPVLLNEISVKHPDVVRIFLASHEESYLTLGSLTSLHHVLTKPCSIDALNRIIERASKLRELLNSPVVSAIVSRLKILPSFPQVYSELNHLLQREDYTMAEVSAIVKKDASMVAKVLHVSNSAYFGFGKAISNIDLAVSLLGAQMVRHLVLANEIFSKFDLAQFAEFELTTLWEHSLRVSHSARSIARELSLSRPLCDDAFAAGILHDIGKLAMVANLSKEYRAVLDLAAKKGIPVSAAEQEIFGAGHAEIGAFLLGLWGLPENIVEAVAYHHSPLDCPNTELCVLSAVYFANTLDNTRNVVGSYLPPFEISHYAERFKLNDKLTHWETSVIRPACNNSAVK